MAATDTPASLTDNVACLDYSAVWGRPLVADRWSGEKRRERGNFVATKRGVIQGDAADLVF